MGYRGNGEDDRRFARCARCDAIAWEAPAGSCHTDANTVCALCGMNRADLPFANSDYFVVREEFRTPWATGLIGGFGVLGFAVFWGLAVGFLAKCAGGIPAN